MAIVCKELKLVYIQVPGTGCSVVSRVLRNQFGAEELGRKHNDVPELLQQGLLTEADLDKYLVVANVRNPYDRLVTYYQRLQGDWTDDYLEWAYRNLELRRQRDNLSDETYQRRRAKLARHEVRMRRRSRILRLVGFNLWLQVTLIRWRLQERKSMPVAEGRWFTNNLFPMLDRVDLVLRQERLEAALNGMLDRVGVSERVALPSKNLTPGKKPYTAYYNGLSRWLMNRFYQPELDFFGYGFGEVTGHDACLVLSRHQLLQSEAV